MRKDIEKRIGKYNINEDLEEILKEINNSIRGIEKAKIGNIANLKLPTIFFCYAPRTGSTLISQVLASTQEFAYITNFTARFWEAPFITLLLEKELNIKRSYSNNFFRKDYESEYGVTKNVFDPHEFGFFWNKFIPYQANEAHFVKKTGFTKKITSELYKEIMAMLSVYKKPFFFKNAIAGLNCHYIKKVLPNAFFIIIKRDFKYVAQSIFLGRKELYGSEDIWFSLRPSKYRLIIERYTNPFDQIASQIKAIYKDIENGTKDIKEKCLEIQYEDFCANPKEHISQIFKLIQYEPSDSNWFKSLPESISVRNRIKIGKEDFHQICLALKKHGI